MRAGAGGVYVGVRGRGVCWGVGVGGGLGGPLPAAGASRRWLSVDSGDSPMVYFVDRRLARNAAGMAVLGPRLRLGLQRTGSHPSPHAQLLRRVQFRPALEPPGAAGVRLPQRRHDAGGARQRWVGAAHAPKGCKVCSGASRGGPASDRPAAAPARVPPGPLLGGGPSGCPAGPLSLAAGARSVSAHPRAAHKPCLRPLPPCAPADVFFALHAAVVTAVTLVQCMLYDRGGQKVSWLAALGTGGALAAIAAYLAAVVGAAAQGGGGGSGGGALGRAVPCGNILSWLSFLYFLSYIKLAVSLVKYIPQVRRSQSW